MSKFVKDTNSDAVLFTGEELIAYIPERYDMYGLLVQDEYISALGIFDMTIDGKEAGIMLPAVIVMDPSNIDERNINGAAYKVKPYHEQLKDEFNTELSTNSFILLVKTNRLYINRSKTLDSWKNYKLQVQVSMPAMPCLKWYISIYIVILTI